MVSSRLRRTFSLVIVAAATVACAAPTEAPGPGFEGGPCIAGACLGGLVCVADVCVVPTGTTGLESSTGGMVTTTSETTSVTTTTLNPTTLATESSAGDPDTSTTEPPAESSSGPASTSTGEPPPDYALQFDGPNRGLTSVPIVLDATEYTVEAWFDMTALDARGAILDMQAAGPSGFLLTIVPGSQLLVFTVWLASGDFVSAVAGSTAEVGVGWHHVAATVSDGTLTIHLDGVAMDTVDAMEVPATDHVLALGYTPGLANWDLSGVVLDDVRITTEARYTADFDPPPTFEDDGNVLLLYTFDEGIGVTATDEISSTVIDLVTPNWVAGYP